jgi:hypothetical protein
LPFAELCDFKCILLNIPPSWHVGQQCVQNISKIDTNILKVIDEGKIFNEVNHVKNICESQIDYRKKCGVRTSEKSTETVQTMKNEDISFGSIIYIVSFVLGIPGTNTSLERVFSLMNAFWIDERNQLSVEIV